MKIRHIRNQKGFSLIEGLLILIAVTLIAFVGYYVWHAQSQSDKDVASSQPTNHAKSDSPSATKQFLVIKEWNVKLPQSAQSMDAYYTVDAENSNNITLYSSDLDKLSNPQGVSCKGEYIAFLNRYTIDDPALKDPETTAVFKTITIGDHVYGFASKKQFAPDCTQTGASDSDYVPYAKTSDALEQKASAYRKMFLGIQAN
jgi:hypothetical protein